jgi:hypothetical protein
MSIVQMLGGGTTHSEAIAAPRSHRFINTENSRMKRIFLQSMVIASLLFSAISTAAPTFPTQESMGGKPFGHSVKNLGDGLYVFRW